MKSTRAMSIMAAMAGLAMAQPETRDEQVARAKTAPPPSQRMPRQKPPRDLTEDDVRRLTDANAKRARKAALRLAKEQSNG